MTTISASSTIGILLSSPAYSNPVVIDSGVTISSNGRGVYASAGSWTIQNAGSIAGDPTSGDGVFLGMGGSVTNQSSGTISGGIDGIYGVTGALTVANAGSITGNSGVRLNSGGGITNQTGGMISGVAGINGGMGGAVAVLNYGTVMGIGFAGVYLGAEGRVTNHSSAAIIGYRGIYGGRDGSLTVVNSGTVAGAATAAGGKGVFLDAGGNVTNQSGGLISGYMGIYGGSGSPVTVVNAGSIAGNATSGSGVLLDLGGSVTNQSGGRITGFYGIDDDSGALTVVNAGIIAGSTTSLFGMGIWFKEGGSVSNQSSGTISGYQGIFGYGTALTVVNAGNITALGTSGYGIKFRAGGSVFNQGGATISGLLRGISGYGSAPITVVNGGNVMGGMTAFSEQGVLFGRGGSITNQSGGSITGYDAVYGFNDAVSVVNAGTIAGNATDSGGRGIGLLAGGSVTNQSGGLISGYMGIYGGSGSAVTVVNAGSIAGLGISSNGVGFGIELTGGGLVSNAATGTISGVQRAGVLITGASGTVVNAGVIITSSSVRSALAIEHGGYISNASTGTISGAGGAAVYTEGGVAILVNTGDVQSSLNAAVDMTGAPGTLFNAGVIMTLGTAHAAIDMLAGGYLSNASTGTISSNTHPDVYATLAAVTVINAGNVLATTGTALDVLDGGTVTNQSTGTITSANSDVIIKGGTGRLVNAGDLQSTLNVAVYMTGGSDTLINTGVIIDTTGTHAAVDLFAGGYLSNASTGTISSSGHAGVYVTNVAGAVVNAGEILGPEGLSFADGGSVTNQSTGTISGGSLFAVYIEGGAGTVTNAGTISGSNNGVKFAGAAGTVINTGKILSSLDPGIQFEAGGSATNQSTGTISGLLGVNIDGGAGTVVNAGVIIGTGGANAVLFSAGFANRLVVDAGAVFSGPVNGGNTIGATAVSTLELASGASAGTLSGLGTTFVNFGAIAFDTGADWFIAGNTSGLAGVISGLANGDTIEVTGITATGSSFAGSVLTLTEASGAATLDLQGVFTTSEFVVTNVSGGVDVSVQLLPSRTLIWTAGGGSAAFTTATNWDDITDGQNPALTAPGATDTAEFLAGGGTITGVGVAAQLLFGGSAPWVVSNITGAVTLAAGASITNASGGLIDDPSGSAIYSDSIGVSVTNAGSVAGSGATGFGVRLLAGGLVTNASTGTISSSQGAAVYVAGATGTVFNAGIVMTSGGTKSAVGLHHGGYISNASTGTLTTGGGAVVYITGGASTIINAGLILDPGTLHAAVDMFAGGYLSNTTTGTISSNTHPDLYATLAATTVLNAGKILSKAATSFDLFYGGTVTNQSTGSISAGSTGIYIKGGAGSVVNSGNIRGSSGSGIVVAAGGSITNQSTGAIYGYDVGVAGATRLVNAGTISSHKFPAIYFNGGTGTVVNSGLVTSSLATALVLEAGGTITNQSTGTIAGPLGIFIAAAPGMVVNSGVIDGVDFGAAGTLVNAGTISGSPDAVSLAAGFTNRLVVDPGALFNGPVTGGNPIGAAAISTLELASGSSTGTLSGIGSKYIDFAQVMVDTGATWQWTGTNTLAQGSTIINAGTMILSAATLAGGFVLINDGGIVLDPSTMTVDSLIGTGAVTIDAASTLGVQGTVTSGETIAFTGSGGTLVVGDLPAFKAADITGFTAGDEIVLNGFNLQSESFDTSTDQLILTDRLGNQDTLQFTGTHTEADFTNAVIATSSPLALTTLVRFNYTNGDAPRGSLIADANGDLFGTTTDGGSFSDGTVFEIANTATGYASTPVTLVSFNYTDGGYPEGSLIADAEGDLFGTTDSGGTFGYGTVFEIANTATGYASAPITLASFNYTDGGYPEGSLIADAEGDLFGTTANGGTNYDGTVFEIANTATGYASAPITLVSFNYTDGDYPEGSLIADAEGDLFGATANGGTFGDGTVFEIASTATGYASAPITLLSFNYTDGDNPEGSLTTDANGDLFGTTDNGGTFGDGTVFEIANTATGYASTPITLISFDDTDGAHPSGSLITDANGDLYGTTGSGGSFGDGTVFEIAKTATGYASAPMILQVFNGTNGSDPIGSLIADANGDLFGTTSNGGDGTVFEITGLPAEITGTVADQPTIDSVAVEPFGLVTITDPNVGQTETVTVTLGNIADGTLSDPNAASDGSAIANGVYTVTGSSAAVTADLDALVFHPTLHQVPLGQAVTTQLTIAVTDTLGQTASDSTTSVVATAAVPTQVLASFDGADGEYLRGSLISGANGDLFGTTNDGGSFGDGTVFEIANTATGYASTPVTLASFNYSDGAYPEGSLITDANGDLFGTAVDGGANYDGTVFEIAKTATGYASTPVTLVSFNYTDGAYPKGSLTADANGDLFGTTANGGPNGDGTVFEIANTATGYASMPTTLASFNDADGDYPEGSLIADANGDLFGTTADGGANYDGTVFEIANTATGYASTPVTLVSFNYIDGYNPEGSLITDANGDLFGTTTEGGSFGSGTVFEIANTATGYAHTPTTLISFNYTDGADPLGSLTVDANGDLFGTTSSGGANSDGTVFEIANTATGYANAPTTLLAWYGAIGTDPQSSLIADASGDLYGTADEGGATGDGSVFALSDTGFKAAVNTVTLAEPNGQTASLAQLVSNPFISASGTIDQLLLDGLGTVSVSGSVSVNTLDISSGQLLMSGGTVSTDPITVDAQGDISGYGTVTGALTNLGTVAAEGGALRLTGSVTGIGALVVDPGATLLLDLGATSGAVTANAGWLTAAGELDVGETGLGGLVVENQATVVTGSTAVNGARGLDIAQADGGVGDAIVTGTQSVLSNTGRFTVGDAGLGSLGVQSAGTVTTSAGAIIANQSSASGSSVNVTGSGSNWQIAGTLNVGLAGAGALSVTNGGSVAAGAIDAGTASGGFGDIVVNGSASQLTATGDFIVGDRANADVALNGGGTISAGAIDIGLNPGASGVVDVEGDSVLNAAGVFNVGDAGNAVLSLGADATVNATSFNIGTAGVLVEFGDPINSGTVTNSNSIVVAGGSNTTTASVRFVDNGLVEVENSGTETITTPLITNTGSLTGTMQISTGGELVLNAGSVAATQTIQFADATGTLLLGPGGIGGFDAVIQDFVPGDTIIVDTYGAATFSQTGSVVSVIQNGTTLGVLTFDTATNAGLAYTTAGALVDNALCFLAGTLIGTPDGERPVQDLAVGDRVLTASGLSRPVVWVGQGRVLATRGRRGPATPVIVRKGALGANVPHRDLHVTKGHALLLDGVLIPVEFLVNHRSVLWDDRAQEVVVYHVELATHDVLVANGAAAESYRDDGNRWLFANANAGWDQPPKPACAPVLTGGAVVDAVWRRLLERAGPRPSVPLTDEADVHLMVDGVRVEASTSRDGIYVFSLRSRPDAVRIVSRAAVPQELGVARDPRLLGVALRRVVVRQGARFRTLGADDAALTEGVHAFEPDAGVRWTDGDAMLPAAMFAGFRGPCEVVVHLGGTATYIDDGDVAAVA